MASGIGGGMPGLPTNPNPDQYTLQGLQGIQSAQQAGSRQAFLDREALVQYNVNYAAQHGDQIAAIYASGGGGSKSNAVSPLSTGTGSGLPSTTAGGNALAIAQGMTTQSGMTSGQVIQNVLTKQAATEYGGNDDPMVYVGQQGPRPGDPSGQPIYNKLSDLANLWYSLDQGTKDKFEAQAAKAGYNVQTFSDRDLGNLWASYAGQAANYNAAGKQMTLWDVLALDAKTHQSLPPKVTTSTNTSYNISNYQDTHALFMSAAQSLLGRAPTIAETKAFQKQLNAYQQANPSRTTQTTTTDATGNSTSTSTSSGGTTAAGMSDLAQQAAQQNPDYGSYQAATTYFNSLLNAIGHM